MVSCRQQAGLTQQQVTDAIREVSRTELTRAAYAQWEVGLTKPDIDRIKFAAQALNVSPAYLAFGVGDDGGKASDTWLEQLTAEPGQPDGMRWSFPASDIERVGTEASRLRVIRAPYDDAHLRLEAGSPLLVDTSVGTVADPGIYVHCSDGRRLEIAGMALKPSSEGSTVAVRSGPVSYEVKAGDVDIRGRVLSGWVRM